MKRYIRLTWLTIAYSFKSIASYRTAFVMNALAQIVSYLVDFGLTWIMVNAFGAMNGSRPSSTSMRANASSRCLIIGQTSRRLGQRFSCT